MILYTSSISFVSILILSSITFLPASISCLILAITDSRWELVPISTIFFLIYSLFVFILYKEKNDKKYFLEVTEKVIVKSPWLPRTIELNYSDIEHLKYSKLSSILNWLSLMYGGSPEATFLVYIEDGVEKTLNIGCAKLDDLKTFCDETNIQLVIS